MFVTELVEYVGFLCIQRLRKVRIRTTPYFDSDESSSWFATKLRDSKGYLEWGSGGSTYLAAQLRVPFISIDSDDYFLSTVKKKIVDDGLIFNATQKFIYRDIGLTKSWGRPAILVKPSLKRLSAFRKYSDVEFDGTYPDLILIDARFRVACALKCFRELQNAQHSWTLVVDDYKDRPEYRDIEKFGKLQMRVGRMAVFNGLNLERFAELGAAIDHYEIDSR